MNLVEGQGLPDFVMLDATKVTEDGFMDNLKTRFEAKQIYTYIGEQLVSLNPFQSLPGLYDEKTLKGYRDKYLYEVQPHIYALADDTFRAMTQSKRDQCMIITGESGAGKTEASKIFMQYISRVSSGGAKGEAEVIKQKLLDSNPVLESFGNAKTVRNDNSSRFGKYMEIQFDGAGAPLGGKISQYLLEKSRVVTRAVGERTFHVFYMFLKQGTLCASYDLKADPKAYTYLSLSDTYETSHQDDAKEWSVMIQAMDHLGFTSGEKDTVWRVLASILHLGNVEVKTVSKGATEGSEINDKKLLGVIAKHLQVEVDALERVLTSRTITSGPNRRSSAITVPLTLKQAGFTINSFAKSLYNAVFTMVTQKLNKSIDVGDKKSEVVIGVLDIYGFEIFENNSFEQFCINYCNEKLQQIFIKLVLKAEQEEYIKEGIEWKEIDYFNNAPIVELIEGKTGILKKLDEACLVGEVTPKQLLEKFDQDFLDHPHFDSWTKSTKQKGKGGGGSLSPPPKETPRKSVALSADAVIFRIVHYAGTVDYNIEEFADKNRDTLYIGLKKVLQGSKDPLIQGFFPAADDIANEKKRPTTAGIQFMQNVNQLITTLQQCQPHYIRCIKSNDIKRAFNFDETRIRHQVRYLNLVETLRVRRAGFCNRQHYSHFMRRYKMLTPRVWPSWKGDDIAGTQVILDDVKIPAEEYRKGKTKLFVRNAQTLFRLEKARAENMPLVVLGIQRRWRAFLERNQLAKLQVAIDVARLWKGYKARKAYKLLKRSRIIQKNVRALHGRRVAARTKEYMIKQNNAVVLQKIARGYLERKFYHIHKERLRKEREENIRRVKNQLSIHIQSLWRARLACVFHKRLQAAVHIERHYRHSLKKRYLNGLLGVVGGRGMLEEKDNFGHDVKLPDYKPAPLQNAATVFKKLQHLWWGHNKIKSLSKEDNELMRDKVIALDIFRGKKVWEFNRPFTGDYNDVKTNKTQDKYKECIRVLFQAGGDNHISFSDAVIKVNRKGKSQIQVVVVTNRNIYKYEPGKYKMIKEGSPLTAVKAVHFSPLPTDTFVVVEMEPPHRDYVLDLGTNGCERYSELAMVLAKACVEQRRTLPVTFGESINFNNGRSAKEPGQTITLKFEKHPKPTPGCKFVGPKGNTATVFYN